MANPDHKTKPPQKPPTTPKKTSPNGAVFPGTSPKPMKLDSEKKITHAYFIDLKGNPVQKIAVVNTVRIRIKTNNMVGENIQFIVWEYDRFGDPDKIIFSTAFKVPADSLDTQTLTITPERFKLGIDNEIWYDPDDKEQQYFIEVIPLGSKAKSRKFGLDDEAKRMKVENGISPAKVEKTDVKKPPATCICKEQYKHLIWGGKVNCEFRKKVVEICEELWTGRGLEMANGLMAVINVETRGSFKAHHREEYKTADDNPKDLSISSFHKNKNSKSSRAVGLIQFTQEALEGMGEFPKATDATRGSQVRFDALNKLKLSYAQMGEINQLNKVKNYFEPTKGKIKTPEDIYLAVFAPIGIGKNDNTPLYTKGTDYYAANESVDTKSNGVKRNDGIIQRSEILERFHDSFDKGKANKVNEFTCQTETKKLITSNAKGIITYHIYSDGKIERHIPKKIKPEFKGYYKYIYHDTNNKEHNICTAEWHETMEKMKGTKPGFLPKHSKIIEDKNVSEGQTQRRVKYENGDVPEYGYNKGKHFWNLYAVTGKKIELVKMPSEGLNYNVGEIIINYKFSGTERKYTFPGALAGFIGALAECGFSEVTTKGSCFREATCFPSIKHVNGESIDTIYMSKTKETKFVKAMTKFKFNKQISGLNKNSYTGTAHQSDHDDHLHSGFNITSIIDIQEK